MRVLFALLASSSFDASAILRSSIITLVRFISCGAGLQLSLLSALPISLRSRRLALSTSAAQLVWKHLIVGAPDRKTTQSRWPLGFVCKFCPAQLQYPWSSAVKSMAPSTDSAMRCRRLRLTAGPAGSRVSWSASIIPAPQPPFWC